jgi:DNA-binding CsgD family transcriptional regulator
MDLLIRAARKAVAASESDLAARLARQARLAGAGVAARLVEAEALYWDERFAETVELLEALEPDADADDIAQAAILAASALFWGHGTVVVAEARLLEALDGLAPGGPREEVLAHLASLAFFNGRIEESIAMASAVLSSPAANQDARLRALSPMTAGCAASGRVDAAVGASDLGLPYALERFEELPQVAGALVLGRCLALLLAGELDDAEEMAGLTRDTLLAEGAVEFLGTWSLFLGRIALERGTLAAAEWLLHTAVIELRQHDPGGLLGWAWALLGHTRALAGDDEGAGDAIAMSRQVETRAVRVFETEVLRAEAAAAAATGERSRARELLQRAIDIARSSGARVLEIGAWHDLARLGRAEEAVQPLRALVPTVQGPIARARLLHVEGLAGHDGGRLDEAAAAFAAIGCWSLGADAASAAADAHQRAGRRGSRLASLAVAQDLGERCGRSPAAGTPGSDELGLAALTDREREVVHLAGRGLTNRQIAEKLYLSVRTVNNHLNHAYAKLGLSERAQLAALVGLAPPGETE